MRFFSRKPAEPTSPPRLIDMTKTTWGHNFSFTGPVKNGRVKSAVWVTPGPKVNDLFKYETETGYCIAEITSVEWTVKVSDMYWIELNVIERIWK